MTKFNFMKEGTDTKWKKKKKTMKELKDIKQDTINM